MSFIIQHAKNIVDLIGTILFLWVVIKIISPDKDDDHSWRN